MNYLNLLIIQILFSNIISQQFSFEQSLLEKEEICIEEYYKIGTVTIISIYSDNPIELSIFMPTKKILYSNKTEIHTFSFVSEYDDYYEFCLYNENYKKTNFSIFLKSGIAAKDFSSLAKTRDFKKSEIEIEKIIERKKNIQHFYQRSYNHDILFEISIQQLTKRIITCSFIIIFVMILIGGVETYYLKKFMERRKII